MNGLGNPGPRPRLSETCASCAPGHPPCSRESVRRHSRPFALSEEIPMPDKKPERKSRAGLTQDHVVRDHIRDVMSPRPRALDVDACVLDAALVMRREDIGDVLVLDAGDLYGILTDRDIVVRVLAEGRDPAQVRIGEACSRELSTIGADQSVGEA